MSKPLAVACCVGMAIVCVVAQRHFLAGESVPAAPREYAKSGDSRAFAEWTEEDAREGEQLEYNRVYRQRGSIDLLPSHVPFSNGQFSVYADFDHALRDSVPLYVINGTREVIRLNYGPDCPLKLEVCDGKRDWSGAQPHIYDFCGNEIGSTPILPGEFLVTEGYKPNTGRMARVRYQLYNQLIEVRSNIGDGLVREEDVRQASRVALSVPDEPLDLIERVALGKEAIKNQIDHNERRVNAIYALASKRFDPVRREKILRQIQSQDAYYGGVFASVLIQKLTETAGRR